LSQYAELSKQKLKDMELDVPAPNPEAVERMKYEAANHVEPGMMHKATAFMRRGPEVSTAAKTGQPAMEQPKREIPVTVPVPADATGFTGDVTVAPVTDSSALDSKPDARTGDAAPATPAAVPAPAAAPAPAQNGKSSKKGSKK